jgi:hypothetical protein
MQNLIKSSRKAGRLKIPLHIRAQAEKERRERARARAEQYKPTLERCAASPDFFINQYCKIYDATLKDWIPFSLWPEQVEVLVLMNDGQLTIILKARQLGLSWLVLAYALWLMLFYPAATILIFSLRETEAIYLVDERLKGMYQNLPAWMLMRHWITDEDGKQSYEWIPRTVNIDSGKHWELANGSSARAFSTNSGDSYTASMAIVDEADLVPDLGKLMRRVKPTIDGGGKMVLLSRADKEQPNSEFKKIYKGAKAGENDWQPVFLPWHVRPSRDPAWYEAQVRDSLSRTDSLDFVWEQYPATDAEALAPASLNKRIPPKWLLAIYDERKPLDLSTMKGSGEIERKALALPGLMVWELPQPGVKYVLGGDPAEGNPTSDNSSMGVCRQDNGLLVAKISGKLQPAVMASHMDTLGWWYNKASVMVERNNHGHAVLLWMDDHSRLKVMDGPDGKPGWLDNQRGKTLLYDTCADAVRTQDCKLYDATTWEQLGSIEGATLRAPEGSPDDDADMFALCQAARWKPVAKPKAGAVSAPRPQLGAYAAAVSGRVPK